MRRPAVPERDAADVDADVRRAGEAGRTMRGDSRRRPAQESAPARERAQADASAQNFADVDDDDDLQFLNMDN